jgi:hypothetical protein
MPTTRPSTLELLPIYDKASADDKKKPLVGEE